MINDKLYLGLISLLLLVVSYVSQYFKFYVGILVFIVKSISICGSQFISRYQYTIVLTEMIGRSNSTAHICKTGVHATYSGQPFLREVLIDRVPISILFQFYASPALASSYHF